MRTEKSCGPDTPTLVSSSWDNNSTDDGGKRARSPGRARRKPLKPLCAGMPGCSGGPVVTNARVYYTTRAAAGASAPGIPHALLGAEDFVKARTLRVARSRALILPSLRGALATKQSIFLLLGAKAGLLRGACHRAALRADRLARNDGEAGKRAATAAPRRAQPKFAPTSGYPCESSSSRIFRSASGCCRRPARNPPARYRAQACA